MEYEISVARDFSEFPAGRYPEDGPYNGTRFRDKLLLPALRAHPKVAVNIDGVALLPSSFWEEIWGGLVRTRDFNEASLLGRVRVYTSDPDLMSYVNSAWDMIRDEEREQASQASH